jgi:hypothetical protein
MARGVPDQGADGQPEEAKYGQIQARADQSADHIRLAQREGDVITSHDRPADEEGAEQHDLGDDEHQRREDRAFRGQDGDSARHGQY